MAFSSSLSSSSILPVEETVIKDFLKTLFDNVPDEDSKMNEIVGRGRVLLNKSDFLKFNRQKTIHFIGPGIPSFLCSSKIFQPHQYIRLDLKLISIDCAICSFQFANLIDDYTANLLRNFIDFDQVKGKSIDIRTILNFMIPHPSPLKYDMRFLSDNIKNSTNALKNIPPNYAVMIGRKDHIYNIARDKHGDLFIFEKQIESFHPGEWPILYVEPDPSIDGLKIKSSKQPFHFITKAEPSSTQECTGVPNLTISTTIFTCNRCKNSRYNERCISCNTCGISLCVSCAGASVIRNLDCYNDPNDRISLLMLVPDCDPSSCPDNSWDVLSFGDMGSTISYEERICFSDISDIPKSVSYLKVKPDPSDFKKYMTISSLNLLRNIGLLDNVHYKLFQKIMNTIDNVGINPDILAKFIEYLIPDNVDVRWSKPILLKKLNMSVFKKNCVYICNIDDLFFGTIKGGEKFIINQATGMWHANPNSSIRILESFPHKHVLEEITKLHYNEGSLCRCTSYNPPQIHFCDKCLEEKTETPCFYRCNKCNIDLAGAPMHWLISRSSHT